MGYNKISFFIDGLGFTFTIFFFRPTKKYIKKIFNFFFLIDINFLYIFKEKNFYPISLKKIIYFKI